VSESRWISQGYLFIHVKLIIMMILGNLKFWPGLGKNFGWAPAGASDHISDSVGDDAIACRTGGPGLGSHWQATSTVTRNSAAGGNDIWNPYPSDNFRDFGICHDIPGISLGFPFFKRYSWDIPDLSHFCNFQIEISLTYLCCS
jgi:hypothetical protein